MTTTTPDVNGFGGEGPAVREFLYRCLVAADNQLAAHIDLELGDEDQPDREHALYLLLGLSPSTPILIGVESSNAADVEYCRTHVGKADQHVDLGDAGGLTLSWEIWRTDASLLLNSTEFGPGLILKAHGSQWVICADPVNGDPLLFPGPAPCPNHTSSQ